MKIARDGVLYKDTKWIKRESEAISREKLDFMDGQCLGEVSIGIEGGATLRKVRRIVEKRVGQRYWRERKSFAKCSKIKHPNTTSSGFYIKRHSSNQLRNIYGFVPTGFRYVA